MRTLLPSLFVLFLGACASHEARPPAADVTLDAATVDGAGERNPGKRAALWSGVGVGLLVIAAAANDDDDDDAASAAAAPSGLCLNSTLSVQCW